MKKYLKVGFALAILGLSEKTQSHAQTVSTPVVGFVKDSFTTNSDTIVTLQLQRPSELAGTVSSASDSGASSTLNLSSASLTADQFVYVSGSQPKTYYALVTGGTRAGSYFPITANGTISLTVDNLGVPLSGAGAITSVEVRPYWTLGTLFPSTDKNVSFVPSIGSSALSRRTKIILPNNVATGINKSARATYFYRDDAGFGYWVSESALLANANDTILNPDEYLTLRHNTAAALSLTASGSVLANAIATYAGTSTSVSNDTLVGIPRPSDYKLSELGFTDNVNFVPSTGHPPLKRGDQILVVSKTGSGFNRAAGTTYYRYNNSWYQQGDTTPLTDATIPAGSAIILRKVKTGDGADSVALNQPNYSL
jgi:uncharacterized protein (TIGR02597 family)